MSQNSQEILVPLKNKNQNFQNFQFITLMLIVGECVLHFIKYKIVQKLLLFFFVTQSQYHRDSRRQSPNFRDFCFDGLISLQSPK